MKKVISLVLAVLILAAMLCACAAPQAGSNPSTTQKPAPTDSKPTNRAGPEVVDVNALLKAENWEFDEEEVLKWEDGKMTFDCSSDPDYNYMAGMLKKPLLNATYKFTLTVNEVVEDADPWDVELLFIARGSVAGSSWNDDGSRTGYTLTYWAADPNKVSIGRCGYDSSCGSFEFNVFDGQPHEIEFTVMDTEDGKVKIILKVDGTVVADVIEEGAPREDKPNRPLKYPEAGNLVVRAKNMSITIG
jgi:hypothetical protein